MCRDMMESKKVERKKSPEKGEEEQIRKIVSFCQEDMKREDIYKGEIRYIEELNMEMRRKSSGLIINDNNLTLNSLRII